MANKTVYLWEVYCQTTSSYQTVWNEIEPTTCPLNSAHTISINPGPRILEHVSQNAVQIIEELDGETQGIYKFKGFKKTIPSGNVGNVTVMSHVWNYPITLMNGWYHATPVMSTDSISVKAGQNTVIGALGAPVYTGNTEITVTNTVIDNIYKGYNLNITDGVNVDDLGECIGIDSGNNIVTVSQSATNNFSPLSPTYVRMTVNVVEDMHMICTGGRYAFAEKKVGGKYIPSGVTIDIEYTNMTGNSKMFGYNLEYLY